jgi:hypothetical protein
MYTILIITSILVFKSSKFPIIIIIIIAVTYLGYNHYKFASIMKSIFLKKKCTKIGAPYGSYWSSLMGGTSGSVV